MNSLRRNRPARNDLTSEMDAPLAASTAALLRGHEPVYQTPKHRGVFSSLGDLIRERCHRKQRRHQAH